MKISELFNDSLFRIQEQTFDIYEDEDLLLFENLQNLNFIEHDLRSPLQQAGEEFKTYGVDQKIPTSLGQNAEIIDVPSIKNGADVKRAFFDDDEVLGAVLLIDGEVVMVAGKNRGQYSSTPKSYTWKCSWAKLFKNSPEKMQEAYDVPDMLNAVYLKDLDQTHESLAKCTKAFTTLIKVASVLHGNKTVVSLKLIKMDTQRQLVSDARKKVRRIDRSLQHLVPLNLEFITKKSVDPKSNEGRRYIANHLRQNLNSRLDVYKASKSPEVSTPEEFLDLIKKEGFLEKIKVFGMTYNMKYNNVNFDKLLAASKSKSGTTDDYNASYIQYDLDRFGKDTEKFYEVRKEYRKAAIAELGDDEKAIDIALEKFEIPWEIKVYLKLDKSSIVVDKLSIERFVDWSKMKFSK